MARLKALQRDDLRGVGLLERAALRADRGKLALQLLCGRRQRLNFCSGLRLAVLRIEGGFRVKSLPLCSALLCSPRAWPSSFLVLRCLLISNPPHGTTGLLPYTTAGHSA